MHNEGSIQYVTTCATPSVPSPCMQDPVSHFCPLPDHNVQAQTHMQLDHVSATSACSSFEKQKVHQVQWCITTYTGQVNSSKVPPFQVVAHFVCLVW